ncbi:MAG: TIGR01212 family radical SAM protein [Deltaproteobacteria bacterium]|nr:TIGR01212 family radical SAM protein [Deltaproteobacteria bacterium]
MRYRNLSKYLRDRFGGRVVKMPLDAGLGCPNRDGTLSDRGCLYCDSRGSGTGASRLGLTIAEQVFNFRSRSERNNQKYIAYFQAYTNTYAETSRLKSLWDQALIGPEVVVLAIGTRPDCLSEETLDLLATYQSHRDVWLEIGLQSANDFTLQVINRGHSTADFISAVQRAKLRHLSVIAHVIIGLPNETEADVLHTALILRELPIDGVKIHSLYVTKGTGMADLVARGEYDYISQEEYARLAVLFLENISPDMVIHRLTGDPHPHGLIGPGWTLQKSQTIELIRRRLEDLDTWQGRKV